MQKTLAKMPFAVFLALSLFVIAALALPVAPARAAEGPECWAVLVGVSEYKNFDNLTYCDDDAEDLYDVLGPAWGESHVRLLTDSQATKANILDAIEWLAANAGAEDTVIFTFSGHGSNYLNGYLCPYDSLLTSWNNDISSSRLASAFEPVNAGQIVVMLDICYAGEFQNPLSEDSRVLLLACRANEHSYENSYLKHGVFFYYVIEALNNFDDADANGDYELSAEEIAGYAFPLVAEWESAQHPVLDDEYIGDLALLSQFVFDLNLKLPSGNTVLTVDGEDYNRVPAPLLWAPGATHTIMVPGLVDEGTGTRYVFTRWDDGDSA
jgi:uncharacterized caspase-like protein